MGGGAQGGADERKNLRDDRGGVRGAGGRPREGGEAKRDKAGAVKGMTETIETRATAENGRRRTTSDPP